MAQHLDQRTQQRIAKVKIAIDDYNDTIHAIIGFVNLYFIDDDTRQQRPRVKRFQGRRLTPLLTEEQSEEPNIERTVSPDLGVVIGDDKGILGEVKKNFPKEEVRATQEFFQLKSYDQNLMGWPVPNQQVKSHEITLLVHQTTSVYARDFYEYQLPQKGMIFERPFSIVEFGRISQMQEFFFLRTILGEPTELGNEKKLRYGVSVPMRVFLHEYAKAKLYDAEPPLPYLAELIWVHVVTPIASESPKFEHLRRKQTIQVALTIKDIADKLDEAFSFRSWHSRYPDRQPQTPRIEWVMQACRFFIECGDAEWVDDTKETQVVIFYQNYDNLKDQFIRSYATLEENKVTGPMLPGFEFTDGTNST